MKIDEFRRPKEVIEHGDSRAMTALGDGNFKNVLKSCSVDSNACLQAKLRLAECHIRKRT